MTCDEVKDRLSAYLDGELDAATRAMIVAHLAACPSCRDELDALRSLWSTLDTWEAPKASPGFNERFWSRASQHAARPRLRRALILSPILAGAIAAIVALAIVLSGGTNAPAIPAQEVPIVEILGLSDLPILQGKNIGTQVEAIEVLQALEPEDWSWLAGGAV